MTSKNYNFISWEWLACFSLFPHACPWSRHQNPNHHWHQTYLATGLHLFLPVSRHGMQKTHFFSCAHEWLKEQFWCLKSGFILYFSAHVVLSQLCFSTNHSLPSTHSRLKVFIQALVMVTTSRSFKLIIQYPNFNETRSWSINTVLEQHGPQAVSVKAGRLLIVTKLYCSCCFHVLLLVLTSNETGDVFGIAFCCTAKNVPFCSSVSLPRQ